MDSNLRGQWDVNTRGRTDNSFREWVNGVTETLSGGTSLDTSGTYDGVNFDGTTGYCRCAVPAGLSTTFPNSDFTMAARVKLDLVNRNQWETFFGSHTSSLSQNRTEIGTEINTGIAINAHRNQAGTNPVYMSSATSIDDGLEHVVVQRRAGNVFSLWVDGVKLVETTIATGAMEAVDRVTFGVQDTSTPNSWFDGTVKWAAVWDAALSDANITALDDTENPFVSVISTGTLSITGVAGLKAVGKLTAAGTLSIVGAASLNGKGKLQSAGTLSIAGGAALKARGKLQSAGLLSITSVAGLKGKGKLASTGTLSISSSAGLKGSGKLQSAGTVAINGAANLIGVVSQNISAAGTLSIVGAPSLKGRGKLASVGTLVISGSAALKAKGLTSSATLVTINGSASLKGSGKLAGIGTLTIAGITGLKGSGRLASIGALSIAGTAPLKGQGGLNAGGSLIITGVVGLKANGKLLTTGGLSITGQALIGAGIVNQTRVYAIMG